MKEPFNCNHDRVITVNHIIIITITDRLSLASHLLFLLPFNGAIVQLLCKNNSSLFVTLQYQQHEIHDCTWSIPPCLLAPKNEKETVK